MMRRHLDLAISYAPPITISLAAGHMQHGSSGAVRAMRGEARSRAARFRRARWDARKDRWARKSLRSSRRNSSSLESARAFWLARMAATPASSATRAPVGPHEHLAPATPGRRSALNIAPLSAVLPTQKAKSQCMRPSPALFYRQCHDLWSRVGVGHMSAVTQEQPRRAGSKSSLWVGPARGNARVSISPANMEAGGVDSLSRRPGRDRRFSDFAGYNSDVARALPL